MTLLDECTYALKFGELKVCAFHASRGTAFGVWYVKLMHFFLSARDHPTSRKNLPLQPMAWGW